jgi:hypothetical protein
MKPESGQNIKTGNCANEGNQKKTGRYNETGHSNLNITGNWINQKTGSKYKSKYSSNKKL